MFNKLLRNSRNLFIVGAVLAAAAFMLAFYVLSHSTGSPQTNASGVPLAAVPTATPMPAPALVAKADVPAFTAINDLKTAQQYFVEMPYRSLKVYAAPDYVNGLSGLNSLLTSGPRHMVLSLPKGQPLLASDLVTNTLQGGIDYSILLAKGLVAQTVSVPPLSADNGGIQPSDHVDMLLTLKFDLTKDVALHHAFFTSTAGATALQDSTDKKMVIGNLMESQVVLQNLQVLNVNGNNYTLAMSHQDAVLVKWIKDMSYTIDLVVRSTSDTTAPDAKHPLKPFTTTPVLPDYVVNGKINDHKSNGLHDPFVLP